MLDNLHTISDLTDSDLHIARQLAIERMVADLPAEFRDQLGGDDDAEDGPEERYAACNPSLGRSGFWCWIGEGLTDEITRRRGGRLPERIPYTGEDLLDSDLRYMGLLTTGIAERGDTPFHRYFGEVAEMLKAMARLRIQTTTVLEGLMAI